MTFVQILCVEIGLYVLGCNDCSSWLTQDYCRGEGKFYTATNGKNISKGINLFPSSKTDIVFDRFFVPITYKACCDLNNTKMTVFPYEMVTCQGSCKKKTMVSVQMEILGE